MTYFPHVWSVFYEQQPGQARAPSETSSTAGLRSAIDSITQNEESKIDYDYVMMMLIINLSTRWRNFKQRPVEFFFYPRFELWNLESDTFHNHTIT